MKKFIIITLVFTSLTIGAVVWLQSEEDVSAPTSSQQETPSPAIDVPAQEVTTPESTPTYDLTSPSSLTVIVNKQNGIPTDYIPELMVPNVRLRLDPSAEQMQIDPRIEQALIAMFNAAANDGVSLVFGSGYRSAAKQSEFYNSYVARDGQVLADTYSARPGYSEHQTGLSFDATSPSGVCHLEICWEETPEGQWISANAADYGFILRYLEGKEQITGYQYEPWHFRYVGVDIAQQVTASGLTLEEFFELDPAPSY